MVLEPRKNRGKSVPKETIYDMSHPIQMFGGSMLAKSQCATCGEWFEDSELDEHLNQHLEAPAEEPGTAKEHQICPHLRQNHGRVLWCAVPSWRNRSRHAVVDWSMG